MGRAKGEENVAVFLFRSTKTKNPATPLRGELVLRELRAPTWCEAQLELISPDSSEEPLRDFYATVFPAQKNTATFSFPDFPHFLN
jgi:hypothetical protein